MVRLFFDFVGCVFARFFANLDGEKNGMVLFTAHKSRRFFLFVCIIHL